MVDLCKGLMVELAVFFFGLGSEAIDLGRVGLGGGSGFLEFKSFGLKAFSLLFFALWFLGLGS